MYLRFISSLDNNLTVFYTWSRSRSPFQMCFGYGPIFVLLNLQHSQAQPYGICTCIISITQSLYVWSMTLFWKSLVLVSTARIRTQDFPISKRILYYYTIELVISSLPSILFLRLFKWNVFGSHTQLQIVLDEKRIYNRETIPFIRISPFTDSLYT